MAVMSLAERAYEFRHVVTRDAAYQMLPPSERVELHRHAFQHLHASLEGEERTQRAHEVLKHLDAINDEGLRGVEFEYIRLAADHARDSYQTRTAIHLLQRMLAHKACGPDLYLITAQHLGAALLGIGLVNEAADTLNEALARASAVGSPQVGSIQGALAGVYMESGRAPEAAELFETAIASCRASGDEKALGRALTNRAILFRHLGRDADHEEMLTQALAVHRRAGNRSGEGLTLMALGGVHRTAEDNQRAEEFYRLALAVFQQQGDRPLEAQALGNLANVYLTSDRLDAAAESYRGALHVLRELGRRRSEAILLGNYSQLLEKLGRLGASVACGAESVRLLESMNDLMMLPPFRSMHAMGLALRGDFEQAEGQFRKAELEMSGDTNIGALDHVLPALFRFRLAQGCGGFGPGRDPGRPDVARFEDAARVLARIRQSNTAKSSGLTRVIDRDTATMAGELADARQRVESGRPAMRFNTASPGRLSGACRKSLLAWLETSHPDQLDWMRRFAPEMYEVMNRDLADLPEPDWRDCRIS